MSSHVRPIGKAYEDERGWISDILEDEVVEHVTFLTSVKGAVRGNHFHRQTYQWLYVVSGALRFIVQRGDEDPEEGIARAGDLLTTNPMTKHALEALEDTTMVVCTRGPRGGREYESDTYRLDVPLIPSIRALETHE